MGGVEDAEAEKRRKRAERFGIPYVEPKAKPVPAVKGEKGAKGKGAKETAAPKVVAAVDQAVLDAEVRSRFFVFCELDGMGSDALRV